MKPKTFLHLSRNPLAVSVPPRNFIKVQPLEIGIMLVSSNHDQQLPVGVFFEVKYTAVLIAQEGTASALDLPKTCSILSPVSSHLTYVIHQN